MTAGVLYPPSPLPAISPEDRLGMTLFFAIVAHAVFILGVGFTLDDTPHISRNNLEIILVQKKSEEKPEKSDYLAQVSQDGGGEVEERVRPTTPTPAPVTKRDPAPPDTAPPVRPPPPPPKVEPPPKEAKPALTQTKVKRPEKAKPKQPEVKKRPKAEKRVKPKPKPKVKPKEVPVTKERIESKVVPKKRISAAALISQGIDMASLDAELDRKRRAYSERPRHKYISTRTQEYKYAAYMEAWRAKVERIGNLNYPDEARRRKLSGKLLLDVALKPDGSIMEINLRRSSGFKVLDDAAIRIVRLASPYTPFPKSIRQETDILHIERTWQFLGSNRLFAK